MSIIGNLDTDYFGGRSGNLEALADAPEPPDWKQCPDCIGVGEVYAGYEDQFRECRRCNGNGYLVVDPPMWPAGPGERDHEGELIETVDLRKVFLALQVQWDVQIEAFKEGVHVDPEQIERLGTQIAGTIRVIQEGQ